MSNAAVLKITQTMSPAAMDHQPLAQAYSPKASAALSRQVVGDLVAASSVVAAGVAVYAATVLTPARASFLATDYTGAAELGLACLMILGLFAIKLRGDRSDGSAKREAMALFMAAAATAGTATFITLGGTLSPAAIGSTLFLAATGGIAAGGCRLALATAVAYSPLSDNLRRRVAVYGASQDSARAFEQFASEDAETFFVGLFDERADGSRQTFLGVPVAGGLDDLVSFAKAGAVDEIIIALPYWAADRTKDVAALLGEFPVDVYVSIEAAKDLPQVGRRFHVSKFGNVQYAQIQRSPLRDWALIAKVVQDRVGGTLLLAGLSPILAIIAAAIKLDSAGPVFFRQKRHGLCGRQITVWKFRTMRVMENGAVIKQASRDDDRITRVGRILRKTSLDELPQLINVVLGEMSIVGPRPHAIAHNEYYAQFIEAYNGRNQMKPGITGWAQVNGYRGETKALGLMEKRIEHDLWYIRNWSIWLDIKIILLTPIYGLVHKNAY